MRRLLTNSRLGRWAIEFAGLGGQMDRPRHPLDQSSLAALRASGVTLRKPREITNRLRFSWEDSADKATRILRSAGYMTRTTRSRKHPALTWCVDAQAWIAPTARFIDQMRTEFEHLAKAHGGVYDGWYLGDAPPAEDGPAERKSDEPVGWSGDG